MSSKPPKVFLWIAESLNEMAEAEDNDELLPSHTPGSPMFWFNGMAREMTKVGPEFLALLTPSARKKLFKCNPALRRDKEGIPCRR